MGGGGRLRRGGPSGRHWHSVIAALVAVAAGSLLFALHKAKAASELSQAVENLKRQQQKNAASLQFIARHCTLARQERQQAVEAEARRGGDLSRRENLREPSSSTFLTNGRTRRKRRRPGRSLSTRSSPTSTVLRAMHTTTTCC